MQRTSIQKPSLNTDSDSSGSNNSNAGGSTRPSLSATDSDLVALKQRVASVSLRSECYVAVPEPLRMLFPTGGLAPGSSIGVSGDGGWSVAFSLVSAALSPDGWIAIVGLEDLGLLAASEYGIPLDRILVIETPPAPQFASVVAWLIEAVEIVCINPAQRVKGVEARRLSGRAREQQTLLFHLDGGRSWPQALDVSLTASTHRWEGTGQGHGRLQRRLVSVAATGRRSMARYQQAHVWLPGASGSIEAANSSTELDGTELDGTGKGLDFAMTRYRAPLVRE